MIEITGSGIAVYISRSVLEPRTKIQIRCKRNSVKCDLLQRAVGQITEQAICIFAQYFYFEKYVALGKLYKIHKYEKLFEILLILGSTF